MVETVEKKLETDTAYKAVDYIETYTGKAFFPSNPRVEDVTIIDIAHHLSNQCRYSGATAWHYSTAQHCCLLATYAEYGLKATPLDCLQMLIHDAAEAYLVDLPRPIKQHMPEFRVVDCNIQTAVRKWLTLDTVSLPSWQDELDSRIIVDERAQVMSDSGNDWKHDLVPLGIEIAPWEPYVAEQQFLMRYANYSQKVFGSHQYLRSGWGIPLDAKFTDAHSFRTAGGDLPSSGEFDPTIITDLKEVDLRGGVGRVAMRSENGMMIRDTNAGRFPRPAWKWIHGKFLLTTPRVEDVKIADLMQKGL